MWPAAAETPPMGSRTRALSAVALMATSSEALEADNPEEDAENISSDASPSSCSAGEVEEPALSEAAQFSR